MSGHRELEERVVKLENRQAEHEAHIISVGKDLEFVLQHLLEMKEKELRENFP